jgi:hypothetical protein
MTENYSNGNIKIIEKMSMYMRHKNLCSINFQIQNFPREKSALSTTHKFTKSEDRSVLSKSAKPNSVKSRENFPTYKSIDVACRAC